MEHHLPPKLSKVELSPSMQTLVDKSKKLYQEKLAYFVQNHKPPAHIVTAPGRVNLIGEHTDYTGGFVLPLAIDFSTVAYGTGFLHTGKGAGPTTVRLRIISDKFPDLVEERRLSGHNYRPPDESEPRSWVNYVVGVVVQYMPDLPEEECAMDLAVAFASDVPLGAGLSSSASLEVATAVFLEEFMREHAYSSLHSNDVDEPKERALRCQKAENEWALSPCGIMDQFISSAAKEDHLMLLDCNSLQVTHVPMKKCKDEPVILITNSKVSHSIADSEYSVRRNQCDEALAALQSVPLYHVLSLRDATLQDVKDAKDKIDNAVVYHRAVHVVTENQRTMECKTALKLGMWDRVGELMNASHASLRDDYQVSCEEIDFLVDVAQKHDGVYGSRMTGGGFGGCTVTLVSRPSCDDLMETLKREYQEKFGKRCECFVVTHPGPGARALAIDKDCKPESDFYK